MIQSKTFKYLCQKYGEKMENKEITPLDNIMSIFK